MFTAVCAVCAVLTSAAWLPMPVMSPLTAPVRLVVPPLSTPAVCWLALARALRLSPVPPALLFTVKLSPAAGVPLICTCQPLAAMLPPSV